jgi:hypothetical protein
VQLSAVVDGEAVSITTAIAAGEILSNRVYDVRKLLRAGISYDDLIECVTSEIEPDSWEDVGGPGSVKEFSRCLVVRQTGKVHAKISLVLKQIHRHVARGTEPVPPLTAGERADRKVRKALQRRVTARLENVPLDAAIAQLAERHSVPLQIRVHDFEDEGIALDPPVSVKLIGVRLDAALDRILQPLKLEWYVENGVLQITTKIAAEEALETRTYNVGLHRNVQSLFQGVMRAGDEDSWEDVGGPGSLTFMRNVLIVRQTEGEFSKIEAWLKRQGR